MGFQRDEPAESKLDKLRRMLSTYRFTEPDTLALMASLLSLPHPANAPPLTLSPQKQKEETRAALVAWTIEEAEKAPSTTSGRICTGPILQVWKVCHCCSIRCPLRDCSPC